MTNLDVIELQPISSEAITVESQLQLANQQSSAPSYLPKIKGLTNCKPSGYCIWCCCGICCPLPTVCCLGQKMGDKWSWAKYGIPGHLIFS